MGGCADSRLKPLKFHKFLNSRLMQKDTKPNKQSLIHDVISRFLFILLCWIPLLNIVISFWIIILPYWLFTGKFYFDTYHFKRINDWHSRLIR